MRRSGLTLLGLEDRAPAREAMLLRLLGREVGCDRELDDGDEVDLGSDVKLTVVHTPGHTPGSVCYLWEAAGILITGDSIQARGSRVGGMPVLEDPSTYAASLKKAESVGATSLFMGHAFKGPDGDLGPVATGGNVAAVFRESLAVHEAWTGAVRAGPLGAAERQRGRAGAAGRRGACATSTGSATPTAGTRPLAPRRSRPTCELAADRLTSVAPRTCLARQVGLCYAPRWRRRR